MSSTMLRNGRFVGESDTHDPLQQDACYLKLTDSICTVMDAEQGEELTKEAVENLSSLMEPVADITSRISELEAQERSNEQSKLETMPGDVIEKILFRLGLKPLTSIKALSTIWHEMISLIRSTSDLQLQTHYGLVFQVQRRPWGTQREFLIQQVKDAGHQSEICSTFKATDEVMIEDSCNGLLLFKKYSRPNVYLVYNSSLDQWLAIPTSGNSSNSYGRLAFDGVHHHFKVVCHFEVETTSGVLLYLVYSSESGHWTEHKKVLHSLDIIDRNSKDRFSDRDHPTIYKGNNFYWLWNTFLMVYKDEDDSLQLIELPKRGKSTWPNKHGRALWSDEENLIYCEPEHGRYNLWKYPAGGENEVENPTWELKCYISIPVLFIENPLIFEQMTLDMGDFARVSLHPCAFNEELQILYFRPGTGNTILAYPFETQMLSIVWSCSCDQSIARVYPFRFSDVKLKLLA